MAFLLSGETQGKGLSSPFNLSMSMANTKFSPPQFAGSKSRGTIHHFLHQNEEKGKA
ncbi:hypothetical protein SAY86_006688 [Trapa natans]|uniref:Uncharacterized protein n=1 Tax=Trapa natans TaxID=22666 RepID=A0AAN7L699_TRANT|nr:hypothetical protein SAY86_006688 [Trapa natans]